MAQLDMTRGSIPQNMIRYSVPLILGNLFQLTYNLVDSVIAGRFIGKEALAAAGIASPVMNILILGVSGLCIGAGVLMSEFFGAGDEARLRRELSTVLLFGLAFSAAAVGLSMAFTPALLAALRVPPELLTLTGSYLRVIFLGVPFTYLYNALSAALKSVGDSRTPLRFLIFSSVFNAALDVLFVGILGLGLVWSAIATVLAQGASAVLCAVYIYRSIPALALGREELRLDRALLGKTLQYGAFTALQQASLTIGKLLVQGCVNPLGVDAIAAFNAVTRMDDFAFTPEQSIGQGITTFVAQNRGRRGESEEGRAHIRRGFRVGLALEAGYWLLICPITLLLRRPLILLFGEEGTEVMVALGSEYLGLMAFFYLMAACTNGIQGFFRGQGRMWLTFASTTVQMAVRVCAVQVLAPKLGLVGVAVSCAVGWACMLLFEVPFYAVGRKKGKY